MRIEGEVVILTSGVSIFSGLSKMSHSTSTDVSGLMAIPASISWSCIYRINSLGFVLVSEQSAGFSAAVDVIAAS